MSIKQAQEWLNQRLALDRPLYAVMVQLEKDGKTDYRLVWGGQSPCSSIEGADWGSYAFSREIAYNMVAKDLYIRSGKNKITRAFIVKKDTEYRVIEEVKDDGA